MIRVRASVSRKTLFSCGRFTHRNRRLGLAKSYCAETDFSQKCNVLNSGTQQNIHGVIQERQKAAQAPWFPSHLSDCDLLGMRRLWALGVVAHNRTTSRIGHNYNDKIYWTFCRFLKNSASTFWHVIFAAKIFLNSATCVKSLTCVAVKAKAKAAVKRPTKELFISSVCWPDRDDFWKTKVVASIFHVEYCKTVIDLFPTGGTNAERFSRCFYCALCH